METLAQHRATAHMVMTATREAELGSSEMADNTEASVVASATDAAEVGTSGDQGIAQAPEASPDGHSGGRSAAAMARAVRTHAWLESNDVFNNAARCVGIVYDEEMMLHCGPEGHPEQPARIHERMIRGSVRGWRPSRSFSISTIFCAESKKSR